jgi:hypothetical protein
MTSYAASKRMSDLLALELIRPTGRLRPGASGSDQQEFVITEAGLEAAADG